MYTDDWRGLYRERWGEDIVPDAYAHPAKFARALIRRIYDHLVQRGYLKPGDSVVDPFGGVALGALDAMQNGLHWYGMELEQKFVDLGRDNLALWEARYRPLWPESWGTARLYQGDSRELSRLLREAGAVVSSPPHGHSVSYQQPGSGGEGWELMRQGFSVQEIAEMRKAADPRVLETRRNAGYSRDMGNLGNMRASDEGLQAVVSSPPYAETINAQDHGIDWSRVGPSAGNRKRAEDAKHAQTLRNQLAYSNNPANLGGMKAGSGSLSAVISSPPFGEGETRDRSPVQAGEIADCITRAYTQDRQGSTPGNLAHLETTEEGLQAVVSSPPYIGSVNESETAADWDRRIERMQRAGVDISDPKRIGGPHSGHQQQKQYGSTPGQLAQESTGDFWHAARQIVDECYTILARGAVAVWVVKRFVRDKQIVPFPDQWRQMCEAAGFVTLEWIRAWVVEEHGEQLDLFGGSEEIKKERKSFFRRLYESKYPENAIDWEDVLIMRRER